MCVCLCLCVSLYILSKTTGFLHSARLIEQWIWTQWEKPAVVPLSQLTITHTHISVRLSFMLVLYANIQPPAVFQPVTEDTKGKNSLRITKFRYNAPAVRPSLPIGDI